jgi:hypothetical protein
MLVGRLGEANNVGFLKNGLTIRHDGVRGLDFNTSVVFSEILKANFQMEFTSTSDDVFTGFFDVALDARVGLGESLETFDELRELRGVLGLDSNTHDGGDGELHDTDVVSGFRGGDGSGLDQVLIDSDETNGVTARNIFDGLDITTHHKNGSLDGLLEDIVLLAGNVVGSHNSDLLSGSDGSREDTTESVETSLIGSGHHLGDVHHEGSVGVAVTDTSGAFVVHGSFVEILNTIPLSVGG